MPLIILLPHLDEDFQNEETYTRLDFDLMMARSAALVTGGAKRIGAAICLHLAEKGHSVAVHHNSSTKAADQLTEKIRGLGVDACTVKGDLSNPEEFTKIIAEASSKIGPILHLVNNASKFEHDNLESVDNKSWKNHMDINAKAPLMLTRELLQNLPENLTGSVVNILDQKIAAPNPDHISYTASRYALLGITEALARGLAPKLRINAIAPGHTLASPDQTDEGFSRAQSQSPMGYGPSPEDIAQAVVFLIEAKSITGQVIFVDAGERFLSRGRDVVFETEGVN
ncbi:MAG: short chain dehydrogenase [Euryarchaeota archaeon]|nr:short chain dehydrogenase [Euryarchaeota archaeon]